MKIKIIPRFWPHQQCLVISSGMFQEGRIQEPLPEWPIHRTEILEVSQTEWPEIVTNLNQHFEHFFSNFQEFE